MGASLLAMRPAQPPSMLPDPSPSRAGSLLQGISVVWCCAAPAISAHVVNAPLRGVRRHLTCLRRSYHRIKGHCRNCQGLTETNGA
ncbi:hypothetical protein C9I49_27040 [Pseudomonas prosekii]|uniref:Uncharacterized protein n=1 Tax=Pseudomonas prosekii TaxID=1148509 RepID=A0A2U2D0L5_9PSED|nr:hypothetical protein C9I49_27040 [Pseudomonas prosekii]